MSIRIKKVLGYGFTDIKHKDGEIIDDRFRKLWLDTRFEPEDKTIEGYFEFAKRDHNNNPRTIKGFDVHLVQGIDFNGVGGKPHLWDFVTYEDEGGDPSVMVFTPITGSDWKRFDDQIDYYDERARGHWDLEPHYEILDTPIYPYDNYINNETGETADHSVREWIYMFRNSELELAKTGSMRLDDFNKHLDMREFALKELGCSAHWTEKWNVAIPEQIQHYFRYMEVFRNDKSMWKLLPMIYTYWS